MRMLYCPLRFPFERFEAVAGQAGKVLERNGRIKAVELQPSGPMDAREGLDSSPSREVSSSPIGGADYQCSSYRELLVT